MPELIVEADVDLRKPLPECFTSAIAPVVIDGVAIYYAPILRGPDQGGIAVLIDDGAGYTTRFAFSPSALIRAALVEYHVRKHREQSDGV